RAVAGAAIKDLAAGFHHAATATGMYVHHPHAQLGGRAHRVGGGVGNVMELEVEEDFKPLALERLHDGRPSCSEQLLAYLEAALGRVQTVGHGDRGGRIGEVQGNNYRAIAGHLSFLCHMGRSDGLAEAGSDPFKGRVVDQPWQVGHCQCSCLAEKPQAWQRYLGLSLSSASTMPRRIIRLAWPRGSTLSLCRSMRYSNPRSEGCCCRWAST